jgi:oligopeptide/dipeptide ABC transporter ATP-binding protein
LLSAVPIPDPDIESQRQRVILEGDLPSPANLPSGCNFHTHCPIAVAEFSQVEPEFRPITASHQVACHLVVKAI